MFEVKVLWLVMQCNIVVGYTAWHHHPEDHDLKHRHHDSLKTCYLVWI